MYFSKNGELFFSDDRIRSLTISFDGMVYEDAVTLLANHGWTLARYSPGDTVPEAWARVPR